MAGKLSLHFFALMLSINILLFFFPLLIFGEIFIPASLAVLFLSVYLFCRFFFSCFTWEKLRSASVVVFALCLLVIGLYVAGYRNLVEHSVTHVIMTAAVCVFSLLFYDSIDLVIEILRAVKNRIILRLLGEEIVYVTGLHTHKILAVGLKTYLIIGAFILIVSQWGISSVGNERLWSLFIDGISLSGFLVSPARITLALILFVICWPAIGYMKHLINQRWLSSFGFSHQFSGCLSNCVRLFRLWCPPPPVTGYCRGEINRAYVHYRGIVCG